MSSRDHLVGGKNIFYVVHCLAEGFQVMIQYDCKNQYLSAVVKHIFWD